MTTGYALPMTNPYGITLDREWTEWAAEYGVSPAVAAAVFLTSKARPIHEVMAKLAPGEFEQVADIVSRWPGQFPPGTLAALKSRRRHRRPTRPLIASRPISRADRALSQRAAKSAATLAICSALRLIRRCYGGLPLRT